MSKDEAWQEVVDAWDSVHQEFCIGDCKCDERLADVKEALNV